MKVHSSLGKKGFQEVIYQRTLVNLEKVHLAQALNYLGAYKIDIGVMINFGAPSLQFKRLTIEKKLISIYLYFM